MTAHDPVVDTGCSPHARLRALGVSAVTITDAFWGPRLRANREATLPAAHRQCRDTGALDNFARAAGRVDGPFRAEFYSDSDVYKWVEAACWDGGGAGPGAHGDDTAAAFAEVVELITAAQDTDGYLNTWFSVDRVDQRWTDLPVRHEMYCLGHLVQAAIAHHRRTGSDALLDVAVRAAALVERRFPPGRTRGACGHPNLEMALVELHRTTGDPRWLELAAWQVDSRGHGVLDGSRYLQDEVPVRELPELVGHAVRMLYLAVAAADLALESDDPDWAATADRFWRDLVGRKQSVSGGVGARWDGEAFGAAYELPDRAYNESCAAIAVIMFAWRMLLRTGNGEFRDVLEWTLHNAVLPGVSADATSFFYQNPLADDGRHRRRPWFSTACCPPNIARLLASLPGYVASTDAGGLWVHLTVGGQVEAVLPDGTAVALASSTDGPYGGSWSAEVLLDGPHRFALHVPAPAWAPEPDVTVNGGPVRATVEDGYLVVEREWHPGDRVALRHDRTPTLVRAHHRVGGANDRVALTLGPVLHCVEAVDHDCDVRDLAVTGREQWEVVAVPGLTEPGLTASAVCRTDPGPLHTFGDRPATSVAPARVTAVPYFAWGNRAAGAMRVFLPVDRSAPDR